MIAQPMRVSAGHVPAYVTVTLMAEASLTIEFWEDSIANTADGGGESCFVSIVRGISFATSSDVER